MRQYVIDELRPADYDTIKAYLDVRFAVPDFDGLYWIPLEENRLTAIQKEHIDCHPFYIALELLPDRLACELLVRSRQRIRCQCIQYASEVQRNWIIQMVDAMFEKLALIT
jgi:hypothetical protein